MRIHKVFIFTAFFILGFTEGFGQEKKIQNYICLSAQQTKNLMFSEGYELKLPDSWCGYKGFHDILIFSPKSIASLKEAHNLNGLYVSLPDNKTFKSKSIEEALKTHFVLLNDGSEFAPIYDESVHEYYGKYYIIKHKSIQEGQKLMNLDLLFNYQNQDYIIHYSVLEKNFNANLNEVIQIMESFKINE